MEDKVVSQIKDKIIAKMSQGIPISNIKEDIPDLSSIQNHELNQPSKPTQIEEPTKIPQPETRIVYDNSEVIEKRRLILTIQRYILEFEKYLPSDLHSTDYRNFCITELEMLLAEIKFTVACRNCGKMGERAFKQLLYQLENVLVYMTPLKVQGLHNIANDPDLLDTVKEFQLDNMNLFYVDPKYRIAYSIIMAITNLHMANSAKDTIELTKKMQQNIDIKLSNVNDKFENLAVNNPTVIEI